MTSVVREGKLKLLNQDDKKISIALMSSFVVLTIQYLVLIYFSLIETNIGYKVQLLSKAIVGLIYIYALPAVLRRSKIKFIKAYFFALFIFLLHYAVFPENRDYIVDLLFPFYFMSLPSFIYALSIRELSVFKTIMKKSSYVVFIVGLIIGSLVFVGRASVGSYSMSLSYYMLLPTLVFINDIFEGFSIISFIFLILSLIVILSLGSRGAVLCILVFAFLKFFNPLLKKSYIKIIVSFIILSMCIFTLFFLGKIAEFLYYELLNFGINSRTLSLFLREGVYLSGRDKIYDSVIMEIYKKPITGIGIAGDRRILDGSYVHNFFIELIGNFGLIIGFIISIGIVLLIIRSLITKNNEKYELIILWVSLGFVHLIVSSSYLIDVKFWILFGLVLNFSQAKKFLAKSGDKLQKS